MMASNFKSRPRLISFLGASLRKGRLAMFLGAGISQELHKDDSGLAYGLPRWEALLGTLYRRHSKTLAHDADLTKAAEQIRLEFYSSDMAGWILAVREALYEGVNLDFELIRRTERVNEFETGCVRV